MAEPRWDIVVVGGGPAGLTAGLYAARDAMKTLLVERMVSGGQVATTEWVENYPGFPDGISGLELSQRMEDQAKRFGLEVLQADVQDLRVVQEPKSFQLLTSQGIQHARAVILAMGADWNRLGVPGEEEFRGKGVSYCATCDGPFFRDQEVVVVGGGDTAVEEGTYLTKMAAKVTLVHRRDRLRASPVIQQRAFSNPKMEFVWNSVVESIEGGAAGVEKVRIRELTTGRIWEKPCSGVFVFVGMVPNTGFLRGLVEMDQKGYILTDDEMRTSLPGVFACGDARRKLLRQVVTACGDGATAAKAAARYVEELKGTAYD
ncbi:MAG: thioredoxin-disulfide reductase [bacterium]